MKRILIIAPQPFLINRGTPLAVYTIARALSEVGCVVDIVTSHIGETPVLENVRVYRTPRIPLIREIKAGLSIAKILLIPLIYIKARTLLFKNHYDSIIGIEDGTLYGALLKRKAGARLVHRMDSIFAEASKSVLIRKALGLLERFIFSRADVVVPAAENYSPHIRRFGGTHIQVIEAVPALQEETVDNSRIRELQSLIGPHSGFVVGWIGNFTAYQGFDIFKRAIPLIRAKAPNVFFLIAHSAEDDVESLQALPGVITVVSSAVQDTPNILAVSDVVCSLRDNAYIAFPSKVKVFMRAGKTIIATNTESHRMHLTHNGNAYLISQTPEAFAEAVLSLKNNESMRKKLSENALQSFDERFSWGRFRADWKDVVSGPQV